ncbi:MAG: inner-rane translocator, partial [Clostridia bacterium]|nr:inner-rane translocator [Clostridia bacterium]
MSMQIKTDNKPKEKSFNLLHLIANNSVPLLFLLICAIGVYYSGINVKFIFNEVVTRIGRNSFLVLSLIIPVIAGMGLNFALVIGAMAGQMGLMFIKVIDV